MATTDKKVVVNAGGNVSGLLLVAFIVLKLCHVIDWSWWWVLAPAWIPVCIAAAILVTVGVVVLFAKALTR